MLISTEHKSAVIDNQTMQTLEASLAIQVLKLFSIVARADQRITEDERKFVAEYCRQMFPSSISEYLFDQFQHYLKTHIELESVTDSINNQMAYQEKLFCLLKVYKLALIGEMIPGKLALIRQSAEMIGVSQSDLGFIESIFKLNDRSNGRPGRTCIVALKVNGDPDAADLYLPYRHLNLLILKIYNLYCLYRPTGDAGLVFIDDFQVRENTFTRIPHNADVLINNHTIKFQDLKVFFENKVHAARSSIYLSEKKDGLAWESCRVDESRLRAVLNGSTIWLESLNDNLNLAVNGSNGFQRENVYLNLGDEIAVNDSHFSVREVFSLLNREKEILLDQAKSRYEITNDPLGDIYIADDMADKWAMKIVKTNGGFTISKGDCPYQVKVGGEKLFGDVQVGRESHIFLNNRSFHFDGDARCVKQAYSTLEELGARAIRHAFGGDPGDESSFDIAYGDLVCVMGASECGQDTLAKIVSGFRLVNQGAPAAGECVLNREYYNLKDHLGFVPSEDVLLDNLTVYQNLYYYAKLRFPERARSDLRRQVELVLQDIGLVDKRNLRITGYLRDGLTALERKKLNIGLELLANAEVYLLDEPTQGLSLKDTESIVELLANVAAQGKIVLTVLQQPGPNLFRSFDKMIVMDEAGRLEFLGTTQCALSYFNQNGAQNQNDQDIECPVCRTVHHKLITGVRTSTLRDIDGRPLHLDGSGSGNGKAKRGEALGVGARTPEISEAGEKYWAPQFSFRDRANQFTTLVARNFSRKIRDRSNLIITFLGAPLLGAAVGMVTRFSPNDSYSLYYNDLFQTYLFVAVIVAMFFGMTNSIDEIIGDRAVFRRDRILNLQSRSYLAAKVVILFMFAFLQNALFTVAAFYVLEVRELYFHHIAFLSLVSLAGISLGLLISSIPKISSKAAQNLIVLVLIPQIILGGSLIVYEQMNKELRLFKESPIPEICQLMPSRWAHEGLMVMQAEHNRFDEEYDRLGHLMNDYKRERPKLADQKEYLVGRFGEAYYKEKWDALQAKIDAIEKTRNTFLENAGMKYGNAAIHNKVALASVAFKGKEDGVYSMMVRNKKLPLIGKDISTATYNALAILLIVGALLTITLFMLRYREGVDHHMNRVERLIGGGYQRTFSFLCAGRSAALARIGNQKSNCVGTKKTMGSKAENV